ncbi:hypothetical protein AT1219_20329 [Vibrio alginolyticus]
MKSDLIAGPFVMPKFLVSHFTFYLSAVFILRGKTNVFFQFVYAVHLWLILR